MKTLKQLYIPAVVVATLVGAAVLYVHPSQAQMFGASPEVLVNHEAPRFQPIGSLGGWSDNRGSSHNHTRYNYTPAPWITPQGTFDFRK